MLKNILILNLRKNRKRLNLFHLSNLRRNSHNKQQKKKHNNHKLRKKLERKRKTPNLLLKYLKSLFLKLKNKNHNLSLPHKSQQERSKSKSHLREKINHQKEQKACNNLKYLRKKSHQ